MYIHKHFSIYTYCLSRKTNLNFIFSENQIKNYNVVIDISLYEKTLFKFNIIPHNFVLFMKLAEEFYKYTE